MARRRGKRRDGSDRRPPRLPDTDSAAAAEADRVFLEAMQSLGDVPEKDRRGDSETAPARERGSRASAGPLLIDLHRLTLDEATARVDAVLGGIVQRLHSQRAGAATVTVQIITGKGRHSGEGGAVLAPAVHDYVRRRYGAWILRIEDAPTDVIVGGLPIRGHFHVQLGTKTR